MQLIKTSGEFRKLFLLEFTKELIYNSAPLDVLEMSNNLKAKKRKKLINDLKKKEKKKSSNMILPVPLEESKNVKENEKIIDSLNEKKLPELMNKMNFYEKPVNYQKSLMHSEKRYPSLESARKKVQNIKNEQIFKPMPKPAPAKPQFVEKIQSVVMPRMNLRDFDIQNDSRFAYLQPRPTEREVDLGKLSSLGKDPMIDIIECFGPGKEIVVRGPGGRKKTGIILSSDEVDEVIQNFSDAAMIPLHEGVFKVAYGHYIFSAIVSELVSSKFIIRKMKYNPSFQMSNAG